MKGNSISGRIWIGGLILLAAACYRIESASTRIDVPGMRTALDVIQVTNAAQHELMAELGDVRHGCQVDLARSTLFYHEGPRLGDSRYRAYLRNRLAEAGYESVVLGFGAHPPPPLRVPGYPHPIIEWPDRHTLALHIPSMKRNVDANRISDALACARGGGRPAQLAVDSRRRQVQVRDYNLRVHTGRNFDFMIATAGFDANDWPANLGQPDPPGRGWVPFSLASDS
jgi:hypothetical protein